MSTLRFAEEGGFQLHVTGAAFGNGYYPGGTYLCTIQLVGDALGASLVYISDSRFCHVILDNPSLLLLHGQVVDDNQVRADATTSLQWFTDFQSLPGVMDWDTMGILAPFGYDDERNGLFVTYVGMPNPRTNWASEPSIVVDMTVDEKVILTTVRTGETNEDMGANERIRWRGQFSVGTDNIVNLLTNGRVEFISCPITPGYEENAYFYLDNKPGYWITMTPIGQPSGQVGPSLQVQSVSQYTWNPMSRNYHTADRLFRIQREEPMEYHLEAFARNN